MQSIQFLIRTPIFNTCKNNEKFIRRTLYTAEQLQLHKYVNDRAKIVKSYNPDSLNRVKTDLQRKLGSKTISPHNFLSHLTQYLHLIDDNDNEFVVLETALDKFKNSKPEHFKRSSFGAILMKVLHHFHKVELALKLYNDPILLQNCLEGKHCSLIYFDLLFKQQRYSELLQQFELLKERLALRQQLCTRSIYILVFATCYAQNTPKSFDYAKKLNDEYSDKNITLDHLIFLAALALNQNAPQLTNQILYTLWQTSHEAIPSLRLISLIQMHQFTEALQLMRSHLMVYDNNRAPKSVVFSAEIIQEAEKLFEQTCEEKRLLSDFQKLRNSLTTHGYTVDKKITQMIYESFKVAQMTRHQKNRMFLKAGFDKTNLLR